VYKTLDIHLINEAFAESLAVNANAVSAGKSVAVKKITESYISEDESLLFGVCSGSGKSNYAVSVDFSGDEPIARCSCPSRQIPCKHALGLLFSYLRSPDNFKTKEIPQDILDKRKKIEKRVENKKAKLENALQNSQKIEKTPPTKTEITKATRRIESQLAGIELAEKILQEITKLGFVAVNSNTVDEYSDGYKSQVKALGNHYIGGIQNAFNELLVTIDNNSKTKNASKSYSTAISATIELSTLLEEAKKYLTEKKNNPTEMNLDTAIEEKIGHIWKTDTLLGAVCYVENVSLLELFFYRFRDEARREVVDEASYIDLESGKIYRKENYYPIKGITKVKKDNNSFGVVTVPRLAVYPGKTTPRVRFVMSECSIDFNVSKYLPTVKNFAVKEFTPLIKEVKEILRNPLDLQHPVFLVKVTDIIKRKNENGIFTLITDEKGTEIMLADGDFYNDKTVELIEKSDKKLIVGNVLCVAFGIDIKLGQIYAKPLSVITDEKIVRLL
jgi:hypothetical protein